MKILRREEGSALVEMVFSVIILGFFLFFLIGVGSLLLFTTSMRVTGHVSSQAALTAYDRRAFDSDTGLGRDAARAEATEAARYAGRAFTEDAYLLGTLSSLGEIGDENTRCPVDEKTQGDPVIQENQATDLVTVKIRSQAPWQLGVFTACLDHETTIVGAYG
jgi:hypothetical protein